MKITYKPWLAGLAAALVLAVGCSNNNDNNNGGGGGGGNQGPGAAATVPESAGDSVASFVAYVMGLSATDETSEPLLIKDSFAVPPDEAAPSQILS